MKLTTRHLIRGTGQHRRTPFLPGQLVATRFVRCTACGGVESAATVHGTALLCAEGHQIPGDTQ